ncbi:MAG: hypothetical protein J2P18_08170 [Nocardia sp.]|nr:hypothetical protein [Nocardia sp.]
MGLIKTDYGMVDDQVVRVHNIFGNMENVALEMQQKAQALINESQGAGNEGLRYRATAYKRSVDSFLDTLKSTGATIGQVAGSAGLWSDIDKQNGARFYSA